MCRQPKAFDNGLSPSLGLCGINVLQLQPERDFLPYRVFAQLPIGVLEQGRNVSCNSGNGGLACIELRNANGSRRGLKQPVHKLGERRFARTVFSHNGNNLAREDVERET